LKANIPINRLGLSEENLLRSTAIASNKEIRFGKVEYLFFEELEKLTGRDFNRLPLVKRHGFKDEAEYRIIAESGDRQRPVYPIDFQLSWINRIIIYPRLPDTISKSVIGTLSQLPNCTNLHPPLGSRFGQFLHLFRRFSPSDLRKPPRGRRLRPSSALSIRIVLPHLRRRVPAVAKFGVSQW
jgi:hypothetical protein